MASIAKVDGENTTEACECLSVSAESAWTMYCVIYWSLYLPLMNSIHRQKDLRAASITKNDYVPGCEQEFGKGSTWCL